MELFILTDLGYNVHGPKYHGTNTRTGLMDLVTDILELFPQTCIVCTSAKSGEILTDLAFVTCTSPCCVNLLNNQLGL